MREALINPRLYITFWFRNFKKYKMKPSGHFAGNHPGIISQIILDYHELYKADVVIAKKAAIDAGEERIRAPRAISDKMLEHAWTDFLVSERKAVTAKIVDSLTYTGEDDTELRNWLTGVIGPSADFEFKLTALKHTLWCAKRKLFDLPVVHHLTPLFWGAQNGGKSTAVKKLIEPLKDLTLQWSIDQVTDTRNTKSLSENYICILDEMAGLHRVDMEELKRILTGDLVDFRPMRTNDVMKVPQNCTFIGTSNKCTQEIIWDPTGVRRYVDYPCLDNMNRELINNADVLKIWKSIDENIERGFYDSIESEMKRHQETITAFDEFVDFVDGQFIAPTSSEHTTIIPCHELYTAYLNWRAFRGYADDRAMKPGQFYGKLGSYNLERKRINLAGERVVAYTINKNSNIFKRQEVVEGKLLEFAK